MAGFGSSRPLSEIESYLRAIGVLERPTTGLRVAT